MNIFIPNVQEVSSPCEVLQKTLTFKHSFLPGSWEAHTAWLILKRAGKAGREGDQPEPERFRAPPAPPWPELKTMHPRAQFPALALCSGSCCCHVTPGPLTCDASSAAAVARGTHEHPPVSREHLSL